ncbi:MAG: DUF29 domain-containing protein [Lamprocystis purpurea]|jgi:hypothetical protein|uniref:DUF29 domain-containing protein n=1 Tax=Lamprocystis purpurea TaxID=61598 RepID=UPI000360D7AB|nr:DUF29 domain-containing protein [Lamprocystis purpurea]MBV5274732.1 DUF29 domain-containing protein [Lamprocystis purpurea]
MTATSYETDVVAWSSEQARLIRAGQFDQLDLEHIAEEIEDVGKSEQRELASRMAVLIAYLLKWQYQPERQSTSWKRTIKEQRRALAFHLKQVPSLKSRLADPEWQGAIWADAVTLAINETGMGGFPDECPWALVDILAQNWLPTAG